MKPAFLLVFAAFLSARAEPNAPAKDALLLRAAGDVTALSFTKDEGKGGAEELVASFNSDLEKAGPDRAKQAEVVNAYKQRLIEVGRRSPSAGKKVARVLIASDNPQEAKELLDQALASDPNDRDALNSRSAANFSMKRWDAAQKDAARAIELDPRNETAYTARALARYGAGDYLQAIEDAKQALALNKDNEIAFATLKLAESRTAAARLNLNAEQLRQADDIRREYQQMLERQHHAKEERPIPAAALGLTDGGDEILNRSIAEKMAAKEYWAAIDEASAAIARNPQNAEAYRLRALARNMVGEYKAAARDATLSLAMAPNNQSAYDARASAFLGLGQARDALADSKRSIAIDPNNAQAYFNRANAYRALGREQDMMSDYRKAALLNPVYPVPAAPKATSEGREVPVPDDGWANRLWFTLMSTVIGGLLIALGLLRVFAWRSGVVVDHHHPSYQIVNRLGEGGMGVVYGAVDETLERKVAIKKMKDELKLDPEERARFLQEARTIAALRHPNIVEIYSILEEDEDDIALVLEFVEGMTLAQRIDQKGHLGLEECKAILRPVCEALEYAHQHGIVHRDLKPTNIMLTDDGQVKVMDFGIAHRVKGSEPTGSVLGTPDYMAPEALKGFVLKESDIYALGVCAFEMLSGARPKGKKLSKVRPGTPKELEELIDYCLKLDPNQRLSSAKEFIFRLDPIRETQRV